ncbi:hypothetical protein U9S86_004568 [Salmonella enterica]|nr:hypothetical protein [Salmonella enterica]EHA9546183.1 hypothetical protein [Salmonella enterica subsp. enterica serovar Braenderup]EHP7123055.1 hypothetical protein [Salmonella enterica subsp. enterica serovar Thompson]EBH4941564.1 hypothetical protein [Salmonella enterica]ECK3278488.1 hypothetical protein [Salmonella enterica]
MWEDAVTIQTLRHLAERVKQKYPLATMNGLLDPSGPDIERQFTRAKNDPLLMATRHCMTWIIRHGALPITRYTFNTRHDAKALAGCVERWVAQDIRYQGLSIHIPAIAFVFAASYFDLEESHGNWPFYQIGERAIRKGYYSDTYKTHVQQYVKHRIRS